MKRRRALQQLGWGLSGGLLAPNLLSACGPKDPGPEILYSGKVAVIGAGAAGLYAADILRSKGIKVVVYEAREQVGGRIRSLRNQSIDQYPISPVISSDFPIELGAQVILGTDSIFGKIYQDYNLATVEYDPSTNNYVMDGKAKSETDWGGDADFVTAKNFRTNLRNNKGNSQSVQQAISAAGISSRAFGLLNGTIGNAYGSSNEKIGIGDLAESETLRAGNGKVITLKSNPMQDALISRFSAVQPLVQLNTPIVNVNYGGDKVALQAKDGTSYESDKVIVTVPVSVLKNGGLSFSPGLPGTFNSSLAKIGMGATLRMVIEFKKNFWGDNVSYIYGSNVPEYLSAGFGRGEFNRTINVTINGDKAIQYSALGDGALDAVLKDLDGLFDGQATPFIRVDPDTQKRIYILEDWTKRDYILGGYSYPLPGASNGDHKNIGQPINGKLFFAGEATDISGNAGMVNGALASAERVAQEVIDAIKKPS